MPECEHKRTEFLMRRDGIEYVRCLDCDQVFEAEDLEQAQEQAAEDGEPDRQAHHEPRRKKAS